MTQRLTFLLVGGGGREGAFARRLAEDAVVCAVMEHDNPTIAACVKQSGGASLIGDANNPAVVVDFAKQQQADYVFVSADAPLANGVVDALLEHGIKAIGGTRAAARIEWDKIYAMELMRRVCPTFTPFYRVVSEQQELAAAIEEFERRGLPVVVKPQGLTGGKGVKVMPDHLPAYSDCADYAAALLNNAPNEKVLLVEKLNGVEFTVMGLTDGERVAPAPATYDYPYRHENDTGAGTGGMGCFTCADKKLPFLSDGDWRDCVAILQRVVDDMRQRGLRFNGVLNGGFFKTADGIKFMEFNARFGDPEALNVLTVLQGSFADLLQDIWHKKLRDDNIRFAAKASVVKYLVAKEYPQASDKATAFTLDENAIAAMGVRLFFASCVGNARDGYETLKKSRVVAFAHASDSVEESAAVVNKAITQHFKGALEYRRDIGDKRSLEKISGNAPPLN